MELSSSNIKKFLIFSQTKAFLKFYLQKNGPKKFLIFWIRGLSIPKTKSFLLFQERTCKA